MPMKQQQKQKQKYEHRVYALKDILGDPLSETCAITAIREDLEAFRIFLGMPSEEQKRLLAFIQGAQGLKITYDSFFKYVMNPDIYPSRLEHFLSAVLGQQVTIRAVLPQEGTQMADHGSFVIMDIVVELSDRTIVNVEIQKIGYLFPGERASCYISDFIMRQYNRVKDERGKQFSFRDLNPVILIVLMEESAAVFKNVFPNYIHREEISYDSKASVRTLYKTIYISLDTFHIVVHNIDTTLKAWLTFLSSDRPADIVRLVNAYPEFLACYRDITEFRRNPKELIYMYSEALAILDKNTEIYMCEQLKKEVENLKKQVEDQKAILSETKAKVTEQRFFLSEKEAEITEKNAEITEKDAEITEKNAVITEKDAEIAFLRKQLDAMKSLHL